MSAHSLEEVAAISTGWQEQALRSLFDENRLPRRPRCSSNPKKYGTRPFPLELAIGYPYIQYNRPGKVTYIVFDVDRPGAAFAWLDAGLPPPTWTCTNPKNGHAHLGYVLQDPVVTSTAEHQAPARYLAAIEAAFGEALSADGSFNGGLTKNPLHRAWLTELLRLKPYALSELAEYVDLKGRTRTRLSVEGSRGRNCRLFDTVRQWAYRELLKFRLTGQKFDAWYACVETEAAARNTFEDAVPLAISEVRHIAKSISKWTWNHYTGCGAAADDFKAAQSRRGKAKGASKRSQGIAMLAGGSLVKDVAAALSVCERTAYNWAKQMKNGASKIVESQTQTVDAQEQAVGQVDVPAPCDEEKPGQPVRCWLLPDGFCSAQHRCHSGTQSSSRGLTICPLRGPPALREFARCSRTDLSIASDSTCS